MRDMLQKLALGLLVFALAASVTNAQQIDPTDIRKRVEAMGLTPDQLRSKLRGAGYDQGLLDQYFTPNSAPPPQPSANVLQAMDALSRNVQQEQALAAQLRQARPPVLDSAPTTIDSVLVFGLDMFRKSSSRFDPSMGGPVDAGYRLGAGDMVVVVMTGSVELSHSLEVTREGFVVVPQVGQVFVANLTLAQATDVLRRRISQNFSRVGTADGAPIRLYVTVARLRTNQVFVLGDVVAPGSYQVSAAGTMLTALYAAGGPTIAGSLRAVELRRAGRTIAVLDIYDYLLRGRATDDTRLEQGDVLFVPAASRRVKVSGEFFRPAWYEATTSEHVADVVRAAGGFRPTAVQSRVTIRRVLPPDARTPGRDRALFDVAGSQLAAFGLENGDELEAFPVTDRVRGRVTVAGHVFVPGPQGLRSGMKISEALASAGGLKPGAYTDEVVVMRRRPDDSYERVAVRLTTDGTPTTDMALQEDDSVTVYSREQFTPERYVTIGGAVGEPKRVVWTPGLTLRRALLEAGGLREGALLTEVEVARMPESRAEGTLATTQRVPIDSSYRFDRGIGRYAGPPGMVGAPAGSTPEFVLQPYDAVNVLRQPDFEYLGTVVIGGEVKYPGAYAIRKRGERLADLVARAGGLTSKADPDAAVFRRRVSPEQQEERRRLLSQMQRGAATTGAIAAVGAAAVSVSTEAANSYKQAINDFLAQDADSLDRVNVNLAQALGNAAARGNLELQANDRLTIPARSPTVTVRGFVNAPTTVSYVPGARVRHYVARSGGASAQAEESRAFVLQPDGSVESYRERFWLLPDRNPTVRAGALVVVPPRDAGDRPVSFTQKLAPIVQIIASTVAILAVVRR